MARLAATVAVAMAAAAQADAPAFLGAELVLDWCAPDAPAQEFSVTQAGGPLVHIASGLCATTPAGAAGDVRLTLQPCNGSDAQSWAFNPASSVLSGMPSEVTPLGCQAWNTQGGPGTEGLGSYVGLWPCSELSFNSFFSVNSPSSGLIQANATSAGNATLSGLCVAALPPPTPPRPTPAQAAWLDADTACFVHYNMATAAGTQGCSCSSPPPPIDTWAPAPDLDTDAWVEAGLAMGCSRFVYTAKHGCGFLTWNATTPLPAAGGGSYPYSVAHAPNGGGVDVVARFLASVRKVGAGAGFYFSIGENAFLNTCGGFPQPTGAANQVNVTQAEFEAFLLAALAELWGGSGPLAEIWMDGGFAPYLQPNLTALLARYQPQAVVFNGYGVTPNALRWVGSEAGLAPYPMWATAAPGGSGAGDPSGSVFMPAETDFTLQNFDNWFYAPTAGVHSPAQLRTMFETSWGHGTSLIIDIAPMPNGTVPPAQVAAAQTLGAYRRGCYGIPAAQTGGASGAEAGNLTLTLPNGPTPIDRILAREDLTLGQLVRGFTLTATLADGSSALLFTGTSLSANFLLPLATPVNATAVTLSVTAVAPNSPAGAPFVRSLAAFAGCNALAAELDAAWEARYPAL